MSVYDDLRRELLEDILPSYGLPKEVVDYQAEVVDYNVKGGKLNRGMSVIDALKSIRGDALTVDEAKKAAVLGWCIEWLQAFFLVSDDIMDKSITRRGQPCWYKLSKVGMIAINDAFLLQTHLYKYIMRYFKGSPYYMQLIELFIETTWQTELGQQMDLTSQPLPETGAPVDLDRFTMERYHAITKHKTAFYSFYLPVACALILAGVSEPTVLKQAEDILVDMGVYFQVQDDYLDAYADPSVLGKIGTDVEDNKCSWLVIQALSLASAEQKAMLKANYGKHDKASVAAVKALYRELKLEARYEAYEEAAYSGLRAKISASCAASKLPEDVYLSLLHKIYKRHK